MKKLERVWFVSGIDTDAGKSYVTGELARRWNAEGVKTITQKFIQTGCDGASEDIETHRRIMGIPMQPEDLDFTTAPLRFTYPASPDLAAKIDGRKLDLTLVERSTGMLLQKYDTVLLEGAGGLMVPLEGLYTTLDYVAEHGLPLILVTNPKLGSINHTFMCLEICRNRGVRVDMVVYNLWPETSPEITADTREVIRRYLSEYHPQCEFLEVPFMGEV